MSDIIVFLIIFVGVFALFAFFLFRPMTKAKKESVDDPPLEPKPLPEYTVNARVVWKGSKTKAKRIKTGKHGSRTRIVLEKRIAFQTDDGRMLHFTVRDGVYNTIQQNQYGELRYYVAGEKKLMSFKPI